jgi:hypothetical protein
MSLIRWDPFGEVNTFIRLMPNAAAGWPRLGEDGNGSRLTTRADLTAAFADMARARRQVTR